MKLEDLKKLFGEAIDKADFVVNSLARLEKVHSVSLRLDSDGVMSLVFHAGHTEGRTQTDESRHFKNAIELYNYLEKSTVNDFDESYIGWEDLNKALGDYNFWKDADETEATEIVDRISALLKDRNLLAEEIETLKKELQVPKKKSETKKIDKPRALEPEEIDTARSVIFDHLSKHHPKPMTTTRIVKDSRIPAASVIQIMNHEWFEKVKDGWQIAVKKTKPKGE